MQAINKHNAGILTPVISLSKCEGKGPCVPVCPHNVIEMRIITPEEFQMLTFTGKLKTWVHGKEKAYVINPNDCHTCGLCVQACPEKAIKLKKLISK